MADVNLQLVREFFELNAFRVLTNWSQSAWKDLGGDNSPQLFVENPHPIAGGPVPFLLQPANLPGIGRAVVEVRAWHADRFYPSVIESSQVFTQFAELGSLALARDIFDDGEFTTILVISELPASPEPRERSLALLENAGIGHIIEFPAILQDIFAKIDANANYPASATLQTLRLVKRYRFIRNQQLEFAFAGEAAPGRTGLRVEATETDAEPIDADNE